MEGQTQICVAIDIDPCDIGDDQRAQEQFQAFFAGSFMDSAKPIDDATLYDFDMFCIDISLVVDYFLKYRFFDDPDAGIIGGVAFLLDGTYVFGADRQYALSREWENAFNRIYSSSVQAVHIDDWTYELIRDDERLYVKRDSKEWYCPILYALSELQSIIKKKRNFEKVFLQQLKEKVELQTANRIYKSCFGESELVF